VSSAENKGRISTARLLLRPMKVSDRDAVLDIFSDEKTLQFWSAEPISTLDEADLLIQREVELASQENCINWGIALADSNLLVGKISLFQISEQNRRAEIGYLLNRRHWGKGFMSEAMASVLAYAFDELKLHRIEADTDPGNAPSLALLEKFGFSREGYFHDRWNVRGEWFDSVMLGLLEHEYRKTFSNKLSLPA
jgi:ribosomal-protein-alanine N-acetyltransferase